MTEADAQKHPVDAEMAAHTAATPERTKEVAGTLRDVAVGYASLGAPRRARSLTPELAERQRRAARVMAVVWLGYLAVIGCGVLVGFLCWPHARGSQLETHLIVGGALGLFAVIFSGLLFSMAKGILELARFRRTK